MKENNSFRMDLGKLDEFFQVTTRDHDVTLMFWVFPVKVSLNKTEYWAIEDRFVPKDENGNPRGFTVPRFRFLRFDDFASCKRNCEMQAHFQHLVNEGMNPFDAMSASMSLFLRRKGSGMEAANNE